MESFCNNFVAGGRGSWAFGGGRGVAKVDTLTDLVVSKRGHCHISVSLYLIHWCLSWLQFCTGICMRLPLASSRKAFLVPNIITFTKARPTRICLLHLFREGLSLDIKFHCNWPCDC